MYKILDTENNRSFKPELIGSTLEGEKVGEYIKINDILFLTSEVQEIVATNNKTTNKKECNTMKNSIKLLNEIRELDKKMDLLDDEYNKIQSSRKSKGLSLAIYNCSDPEAIQLIKIDNEMKQLEKLQDKLLNDRKEVSSQEYKEEVKILVNSYADKKYKVVVNNVITFTDNFHNIIDKTSDNDFVKVLKLIHLNNSKYLPDEVLIYIKHVNAWNIIEEKRYYINNNGSLLEEKLYYNHKLINSLIYRKEFTSYLCNDNSIYTSVNNISGNYGLTIYKNNDKIDFISDTNIALLKTVPGILPHIKEYADKIINRYKKDKYINIDVLIPV